MYLAFKVMIAFRPVNVRAWRSVEYVVCSTKRLINAEFNAFKKKEASVDAVQFDMFGKPPKFNILEAVL